MTKEQLINKQSIKLRIKHRFNNLTELECKNFIEETVNEALILYGVVKYLKDKEVKNIEIKSLGDLKRAYPDGTLHTVNSYGRIINYSVDREIVYTRHI